jgi:hypothetical protein
VHPFWSSHQEKWPRLELSLGGGYGGSPEKKGRGRGWVAAAGGARGHGEGLLLKQGTRSLLLYAVVLY